MEDMNMKRLMIILCLLLAMVNRMQAQEAAIEALGETIKELKTEVKEKADTIKSLRKEVDSLQKELDKLQKDKESAKVADYKALIKVLEDSIHNLSKGSELLQKSRDTELQRLQKQHEDDVAQIARFQADLDKSKAELTKFAEWRKEHQKQLVENAKTWDWFIKPYENIRPDELENLCQEYEDYGSDNRAVAEIGQHLRALQGEYAVYQQAAAALNVPYDKANIAAQRTALKGLNRPAKTDALNRQLSDYGVNVKQFQYLIGLFVKERGVWNEKSAPFTINSVLDKNKENIAEFCENPWLKGQYDAYVKELKAKPSAVGKTEQAIMSIVP